MYLLLLSATEGNAIAQFFFELSILMCMVSCRWKPYVPPNMVKTLCTPEQTKSQYGAVTTDEQCDTLAPYAGLNINVVYVIDMEFRVTFNRIIVLIYFARRLTFWHSVACMVGKLQGNLQILLVVWLLLTNHAHRIFLAVGHLAERFLEFFCLKANFGTDSDLIFAAAWFIHSRLVLKSYFFSYKLPNYLSKLYILLLTRK